ncbi:hypothetical protein [uncultured Desulfobacter sp.]|uniref:hypothetical protein n=1 Tax=uncultured Desulfobacter sp. TaxID=240139 RepID=UPI002AAB8658|nr:hypothetical protein [uncultured Desulfobacter sp.]
MIYLGKKYLQSAPNRFRQKIGQKIWIFLSIISIITGITGTLSAQSPARGLIELSFNNNKLWIKTKNADLKHILLELSKATDISIYYYTSLEKKVTINRSGICLKTALNQLLRGVNHAVIYSGLNSNQAEIKEVLVLNEPPLKKMSRKEKRLKSIINGYRRQIDRLNRKVAKISPDSSQGKRYQAKIKQLEKKIRRIEKQIY